MADNRVFYACQAVYLDGIFLKNVQSVGLDYSNSNESTVDKGRGSQSVNTNFVFFNKPEVTITIEKQLDISDDFTFGCSDGKLLTSTGVGSCGWDGGLKEYKIEMAYGKDDYTPGSQTENITMKYCLLSEVSYNLSADGAFQESLTFITNNIIREGGSAGTLSSGGQTGSLIRRANFGAATLPISSGKDEAKNFFISADETGDAALLSFSVSVGFEYAEIADRGRWKGADQGNNPSSQNYWKYVTPPISVSCDVTAVVTRSIQREILIRDSNLAATASYPVPDREVNFDLGEYSGGSYDKKIDLGSKNLCTGISFSGGDTGGGNVEATINYENLENYLKII
tara:strand:+ start:130 stop:1152 length:1023 start_codon:yes stop_codon:yes gene_type:complete